MNATSGSLSTARGHGRRRVAIPVVLALLLAGGTAAGAGAIPPGGPVSASHGAKVSINHTVVRAGGRIRVAGRDWKAKRSRTGRRAAVTIKLDDRVILRVLRIKHRRFRGYVRIPRRVRAGRHHLRFLASSPATSIRSKRFRVRSNHARAKR